MNGVTVWYVLAIQRLFRFAVCVFFSFNFFWILPLASVLREPSQYLK